MPPDSSAERRTALRDHVLGLDNAGLRERMATGLAVEPAELSGASYRGISLGLPAVMDRILWKTFMKCFDTADGRVRGWNVRMKQNGIDGAVEPLRRRGVPWTFGHFTVRPARSGEVPIPFGPGVVFDYEQPGAPPPGPLGRLDPLRRTRDAVVSLDGTPDLLLGVLYYEVGARRFTTPSYFTLERHGPTIPW